jgi:hypothetical protein
MIVKVESGNGWKLFEATEVSWEFTDTPYGIQTEGDCRVEFIHAFRPAVTEAVSTATQNDPPPVFHCRGMIDMNTRDGRIVLFVQGQVYFCNDQGKTIDRI